MNRRSAAAGPAPLALLVVAIAWLATAGSFGLIEPTETRYAEIAREMRASGDYLTPRLNGIPHFHKPPLSYWAIAAGFSVLGENAWGARVPTALASLLTLAFTALAIRRRFPSLGIPAAVGVWILGSSALFFAIGRSVASDPYLAAAVTGFWALAPSPWALALLGAGFLAKGPVVLVPTLMVVLIAAAWARERRMLALLGPRWGWILFAAIGFPWYLVVAARTPGLLDYLFTNQIWERYATRVHHRGGPPWYFVAVLLAGALPWTPALIGGAVRLWRERAGAEARLLLCWLLAPLVFFSFSGSKLPAYLLPCLPAAAMIAARGALDPGRAVRWSAAALLVGLSLAGWILGPAALGRAVGMTHAQAVPLPLAAHLSLACLLVTALPMLRARTAAAGLAMLVALSCALLAASRYERALGSPRPIARVLAENRGPGEPVVEFSRFNAGLPFYLRERVRLLEVPRETQFEDAASEAAVIVTRDSLAALAARHPRVWILGPRRETRELAAGLALGYWSVAEWRGETLGFLRR